MRDAKVLTKLKKEAIKANEVFSKRFKINPSTCVTCVKPSGTVSQTVDCASGMHPRYAPYYIRRIRISSTDSLFKMIRDQGVPYQAEVGQSKENATTSERLQNCFDCKIISPQGFVPRLPIYPPRVFNLLSGKVVARLPLLNIPLSPEPDFISAIHSSKNSVADGLCLSLIHI